MEFKWYAILSASLTGKIDIRKKIVIIKIRNIIFIFFLNCFTKFLIFNWMVFLFLKIKLIRNINLKINAKIINKYK